MSKTKKIKKDKLDELKLELSREKDRFERDLGYKNDKIAELSKEIGRLNAVVDLRQVQIRKLEDQAVSDYNMMKYLINPELLLLQEKNTQEYQTSSYRKQEII